MKRIVLKTKTLYTIAISLLIVSFITFYFVDGFSKIMFRSGADFHRYSRIIKALFTFIILIYTVITINKVKAEILGALIILSLVFIGGQFFLSINFEDLNFYENLNTLFKYLFPIIFFVLATDVLKVFNYPKNLFRVYKGILTINSLLILVAYFFSLEVLQTYRGIYRFGYNGLIFAQNEATFIFIFALTTVYYRRFYLGIKERFFWLIVIPSLFVATKGIYLYIILLLLFHVFQKVKLKNIIVYSSIVIATGYLIFKTAINKILLNSYDVFMYMYDRGGLLHALLSGRNQFIEEKLVPLFFEYWLFPNILFGGQDVISHYIEMGFIDLFLFFGIIGSILYLYLFYKIFLKISFNKKFKLFFLLSLILIIATAGHFFESGIVGLHFIFFILINRKLNN